MSRKTPIPRPSQVALPLVGVTLSRAEGGALPADATGLERRLYALLSTPRSPLSLCTGLPIPLAETSAALRRLIALRAVAAEPLGRVRPKRPPKRWDG